MKEIKKKLFPSTRYESILPLFLYIFTIRVLLTNEYLQKLIGLELANFNVELLNGEYFKLSIADITIPITISVLTYFFINRLRLKLILSIPFIIVLYFNSNLLVMGLINEGINSYVLEIALFNSMSLLFFFGFLYRLIKLNWFNALSFGLIFYLSERLCNFILFDLSLIFSSKDFYFNMSSLLFDLTKFVEGIIAGLVFMLIYNKMKK